MKKIKILLALLCFSHILSAQTPVLKWANQMGASSWDIGQCTTVDSSGNVYTIGEFSGTADFDPGIGVLNLVSAGGTDFFIQKLNSEGELIWAKRIGGSLSDVAQGITTDNQGNVYVTGAFSDTVYFAPGINNSKLISLGAFDGYILKLDSSSNFIWVKQITTTGSARGWSISIDKTGHVYTAGSFSGTTDFDPGVGVMNLTSSSPYEDIFIQKLDSNGNYLWAVQNAVRDMYNEVSINNDIYGNTIITGSFRETVDFDPGPGVLNFTAIYSNDIFIQKLDSLGNLIWIKHIGSIGAEDGMSVTSDSYGNVLSTGTFGSQVDFDPGPGVLLLTSTGGMDVYIQKLNSSGSLLWVKQIGGNSENYCNSITMDTEENVYITGGFKSTTDFDPGPGVVNMTSIDQADLYILKLDSLGDFVWVAQMGGTGSQYGNSIDTDNSGNVYSTGFFDGTVDFDPGTGVHNLSCVGGWDVFVQKLGQSTGTYIKESKSNSVAIFPNPTKGPISIELNNLNNVNIEISSVNGDIVYSKQGVKEQTLSIELNVSSGVYFVRLSSENYQQVNKIIVK